MEAKKNILVTGANGQLGKTFQLLAKDFAEYNFVFVDKCQVDITNEISIKNIFEKYTINYCVNCAAYTAVDKAQQENELAINVNKVAVGYLSKICKDYNATFIHISTDYVFDGTAIIPYNTDFATNPVNFYGQTKLEGEQIAIKENDKCIIIRTSWVYSQFGNNFVKTMMRLMNERKSINVVDDQIGSPTYATDLAEAIMQIIISKEKISGIYHYSNNGNISWFKFATEIAAQINSTCDVFPISTHEFPTAAARPKFSVLNTSKIQNNFGINIKNWKDSLAICLQKMG